MVHECKQSTTTSRIHVKKNFQVNTFHDDFKAWMDFYRHCVCLWIYLKYTFSFYKVKLWQSNPGIPVAIVMLSNLHNYPWVVLLQRTAFQWWRHGNRGFLLAEKGIPKLRTATSWKNNSYPMLRTDSCFWLVNNHEIWSHISRLTSSAWDIKTKERHWWRHNGDSDRRSLYLPLRHDLVTLCLYGDLGQINVIAGILKLRKRFRMS